MKLKHVLYPLLALSIWSSCTHAPDIITYVLPNPPITAPVSEIVLPNVSIRDIQLSHYLNQGGFVIKNSEFEITVTKQNRWGEPLKNGMHRYLTRALANPSASPNGTNPSVKLDLIFDAFEAIDFQKVIASGSWVLSSDDTRISPRSFRFHYDHNLRTQNYSGIVEGFAQLLDTLAQDVRQQLESIKTDASEN